MDNTLNSKKFPIVGIGTSAGGLEALNLFFSNVPKDSGMAFVIVQHLNPAHVSMMPELLQQMTEIEVFLTNDGVVVHPNCIYLIPPNKNMTLFNGKLHLFDLLEERGRNLPIDIFFTSLANEQQEKSIGIILSGMGSDGTMGVKAIKEKNGIVLVQDPDTTQFNGMPSSATEAVIADVLASPEVLSSELIAAMQLKSLYTSSSAVLINDPGSLEKIIQLIRAETGHDFSMYKKNTILRRVERRMLLHQVEKIKDYVRYLQANPKEVEVLFKELLIGVTSFFRDTAVWESLKNTILPDMMNTWPNGYVMRAWVAGCSTGEEAYSLAIIFKEALEKLKIEKKLSLMIFATDLNPNSIDIARKGFFPSSIAADITPERLKRFFISEPGGYRVHKAIRELIIFAPQSVISDPPFTRLDWISSRNMLIYLEPELQKKLINLFCFCLHPDGILLLGSAETIPAQQEGFVELNARLKYYKRSNSRPLTDQIFFPISISRTLKFKKAVMTEPKIVENIQIFTDQILLQRFAPASVLVNTKGDIIYITGRTGKYLEPGTGKANWNIHAMAREGLREVLPAAFRKAMQQIDPVVLQNIRIGTNDDTQIVDITILQLETPAALKGMIMVVFNDLPP